MWSSQYPPATTTPTPAGSSNPVSFPPPGGGGQDRTGAGGGAAGGNGASGPPPAAGVFQHHGHQTSGWNPRQPHGQGQTQAQAQQNPPPPRGATGGPPSDPIHHHDHHQQRFASAESNDEDDDTGGALASAVNLVAWGASAFFAGGGGGGGQRVSPGGAPVPPRPLAADGPTKVSSGGTLERTDPKPSSSPKGAAPAPIYPSESAIASAASAGRPPAVAAAAFPSVQSASTGSSPSTKSSPANNPAEESPMAVSPPLVTQTPQAGDNAPPAATPAAGSSSVDSKTTTSDSRAASTARTAVLALPLPRPVPPRPSGRSSAPLPRPGAQHPQQQGSYHQTSTGRRFKLPPPAGVATRTPHSTPLSTPFPSPAVPGRTVVGGGISPRGASGEGRLHAHAVSPGGASTGSGSTGSGRFHRPPPSPLVPSSASPAGGAGRMVSALAEAAPKIPAISSMTETSKPKMTSQPIGEVGHEKQEAIAEEAMALTRIREKDNREAPSEAEKTEGRTLTPMVGVASVSEASASPGDRAVTVTVTGTVPPLAPGWTEARDTGTGKTYYINQRTGQSAWERPVTAAAAMGGTGEDEQPQQHEQTPLVKGPAVEVEGPIKEEPSAPPQSSDTPVREILGAAVDEIVRRTVENSERPSDEAAEASGGHVAPAEECSEPKPLPAGWQEVVDPGSGRTYYYNPSDGTTSWDLPQSETDKVAATAERSIPTEGAGAIPPEEEVLHGEREQDREQELLSEDSPEDTNAVNDDAMASPSVIRRETEAVGTSNVERTGGEREQQNPELQVERAEGAGGADDGATAAADSVVLLPKGWIELTDPSTQRRYYLREADGVTRWEPPESDELPGAGAAASKVEASGEVAEHAVTEEGKGARADERGPTEAESQAEQGTEAKASASGSMADEIREKGEPEETRVADGNALPKGWLERVDPETKMPYYIDEVTGTTTWERPTAEETVTEEGRKDIVQPKEEGARVGDAVAGSGEPAAAADDPEEEDVAATTGGLPPGWVEVVDSSSGKRYYFNEESGTTSWEKPFSAPSDANRKEPSTDCNDGEEQVPGDGGVPDAAEMPLPSGNVEASVPVDTDTAAGGRGSGDSVGAEEAETLLPRGWVEAVDPSSGKTYYYNEENGKTSWEKPSSEGLRDEGLSPEASASDGVLEGLEKPSVSEPELQEETLGTAPEPELQEETPGTEPATEPESDPSSTESSSAPEPSGPSDFEARRGDMDKEEDENGPLPRGWVEALDPASGKKYFFNEVDGTTSWERPLSATAEDSGRTATVVHDSEPGTESEPRVDAAAGNKALDGLDQGATPESELPEVAEATSSGITGAGSDDLPPGWLEAVDPSSGLTYYYNQEDGTTSWDRPLPARGSESAGDNLPDPSAAADERQLEPKSEPPVESDHEPPAPGIIDAEGDVADEPPIGNVGNLPAGWAEIVEPTSGKTYYFNEVDGTTSWEKPSPNDATGAFSQDAPDSEDQQESESGDLVAAEGPDESAPAPPGELQQEVAGYGSPEEDERASPKEEISTGDRDRDEALPPGWAEAVDPSTGRVFYFHEIDGTTSWEKPSGRPDEQDEAPSNEAYATQDESGSQPEETPTQTLSERAEAVAVGVEAKEKVTDVVGEEQRVAVEDEGPPGIPSGGASDPVGESDRGDDVDEVAGDALPPGWVKATDPSSGRTYFYNEEAGTTSWEKPVAPAESDLLKTTDAPEEAAVGVEGRATTGLEPSSIPESELPAEEAVESADTDSDETGGPSEEMEGVEGPTSASGWVEARDPSSGMIYYYNKLDGSTSWEKPHGLENQASEDTRELPDRGEEALMSADNLAVDGSRQIRPKEPGPQADAVDSASGPVDGPIAECIDDPIQEGQDVDDGSRGDSGTLAPGWVETVDPSSGATYYYNEESGTTSWEKPLVSPHPDGACEEPPQPGSAGDAAGSADGISGTAGGTEEGLVAKADGNEPNDSNEKTAFGALPSDWVEAVNPSTGETYYYNEKSGETSWENPQAPATQSSGTPLAQGPTSPQEGESASGLDTGDSGGVLEEPEKATGNGPDDAKAETNVSDDKVGDDALPPGWVQAVDSSSGRTFYYNEETGVTTWEKPSLEVGDREAPPKHDAGPAEPPSDRAEQLAVVESETSGKPTGIDALSDAGDVDAGDEALLAGWVEAIDPSSGTTYYYNRESGMTSWEKPASQAGELLHKSDSQDQEESVGGACAPAAPPDGLSLESDERAVQAVEGDADGEDNLVDSDKVVPDSEVVQAASEKEPQRSNDPLPPGWVEVVDSSSGNIYYFNEDDGTTSWEKPAEPADQPAEKIEPPLDGKKISRGSDIGEEHLQYFKDGAGAPEDEPVSNGDALPGSNDGARDDALPQGWVEAVDSSSGMTYYYNEEEGTTSWERPAIVSQEPPVPANESSDLPVSEDIPLSPVPANDASDGTREAVLTPELEVRKEAADVTDRQDGAPDPGSTGVTAELPPSVENDPLPPGWVEVIEPTSGERYYYNERDSTTSWEKPSAVTDRPDSQDSEQQLSEKEGETVEAPGFDLPSEAEGRADSPDPPKGPSEEMQDRNNHGGDLPPGWVESVDPSSGDTYFYNIDDGTTSWTKPELSVGCSVGDDAGKTADPDHQEENLRDSDGVDERTGTVPPVPEPKSSQAGEDIPGGSMGASKDVADGSVNDALPPGWVKVVDPSTGNTYYYNQDDGETTWEKPSVPDTELTNDACEPNEARELPNDKSDVVPEGLGPARKSPAPESERIEVGDEINLASDEPAGSKLDRLTEVAAVATEVENIETALPPGWVEMVEETSGDRYYYNEEDGTSSWEKPSTSAVSPDRSSGEATDPQNQEDELESDNLLSIGEKPGKPNEVTPEASGVGLADVGAEPETGVGRDAKAGLPDGWIEVVDPSSGNPYYLNEESGATSWEKPSPTAEGLANDSERNSDMQVKGNEEDDDGINSGWTEIPGAASDSGHNYVIKSSLDVGATDEQDVDRLPDSDLPDGWVEVVDPSSGGAYYFNEVQNVTTWDRPSVRVQEEVFEAKAAATGSLSRRDKPLGRPAHAFARFGFGGKLCVWRENPERPNKLAIHRTFQLVPENEVVLIEKSKQAAGIVGPLNSATNDAVFSYMVQKADSVQSDLLWNLIVIASKSRGRLRSDSGVSDPTSPETAVVELLLRADDEEHRSPNGRGMSGGASQSLQKQGDSVRGNGHGSLETVQSLLVRGKREEAVQEAISSGNFAMGLLVASMCSREAYQYAAKQFVEKSLVVGSPLHTTAMLFSGQLEPAARAMADGSVSSFWGGDPNELRRNWRRHVASIISNRVAGWDQIVMSLGDRLEELGETHAAHCCYMVSGCSLAPASLSRKRLTLLGCSMNAVHVALSTQVSIEAYERTEAYEWAKRRGNANAAINSLQSFKLMYAMLLSDWGYKVAASRYVESIYSCLGAAPAGNVAARSTPPSLWIVSSHRELVLEALHQFEERLVSRNGFNQAAKGAEHETCAQSLVGVDSSVDASFVTAKSNLDGTSIAESPSQPPLQPVQTVKSRKGPAKSMSKPDKIKPDRDSTKKTKKAKQKKRSPKSKTGKASKDGANAKETRRIKAEELGPETQVPQPVVQPSPPTVDQEGTQKTESLVGSRDLSSGKEGLKGAQPPIQQSPSFSGPPAEGTPAYTVPKEQTVVPGKRALTRVGENETKDRRTGLQPPIQSMPSNIGERGAAPQQPTFALNLPPRGGPSVGCSSMAGKETSAEPLIPKTDSQQEVSTQDFPPLAAKKDPESLPKKPPASLGAAPSRDDHVTNAEVATTSKRPEAAPKSAPAILEQGTPKLGIIARARDWIIKKRNPDATQADLGEGMQAYYDDKLKVWVFPGENPEEKVKPIGPPPTTPMAEPAPTQEVSPVAAPNDPLAAMMAPPKRPPSSLKSRSVGSTPSGRTNFPGTMMPPGIAGQSPQLGAAAPPQFAVFQPKPSAEKEKPDPSTVS